MTEAAEYSRNPQLMNWEDSVLIVVDIQEKLLPSISDSESIRWNAGRLLDAAHILGMDTLLTEQYPRGLGRTVQDLLKRAERNGAPTIEKSCFSCLEPDSFRQKLLQTEKRKVLACGIETHVCVQQTALDLLAEGYSVQVAVDAVGSRHTLDHEIALRRLETEGVVITTTEAAIFEWCRTSTHPQFKQLQELIKTPHPEKTE